MEDGAVFAIEVGEAHGVDFDGGAELAGPIIAGEGEAGVFNEERIKAEVAGHANGGFDGVVGDDSGDEEQVVVVGSEEGFEFGSDEGAVGLLGDDGFVGQGLGFGLEVVAGLAGAVVGGGLGRVVADVIDGAVGGSPGVEEGGDVGFGVGVIALAPGWVVDGVLEVDEDESGVVGKRMGQGSEHG